MSEPEFMTTQHEPEIVCDVFPDPIVFKPRSKPSEVLALAQIMGIAGGLGLDHLMPNLPKRYYKEQHVKHQGNKERARRLKRLGGRG